MFPIRDNVRAHHPPFVTYAIVVANVAAFLYQVDLPRGAMESFIHLFGAVPRRLTDGAWAAAHGYPHGAFLTLFSSMFLHGGWFHLISNMWALWLFGDNVEDRLGHARYAAFYVLCGALAMAAHTALNPLSAVPAVGASGAIAGVMGGYMLFFPFARMIVLIPILFYPLITEVPAFVFLLIWFVSQVAGGTSSLLFGAAGVGGVAFWAHVGGFVAGMFLARRWAPRPRGRGRAAWNRDEYFPW